MHILWITNIPLPPLCEELGWPVPAIGGWMYSSLKRLAAADKDILVAVATVYHGNELIKREICGITYWVLPLNGKSHVKYNSHLESLWREVGKIFMPDVVHIHGSEYPHGLAYVNACGSSGVVVSIQGIISRYARYYTAGIEHSSLKKYLTLRDLLKGDSILKEQFSFERRGKLEVELLQGVNHIIGRTDWDKSHAWAINPTACYHHCEETLRDEFYRHKWNYSGCEPYSIFVSQASYPIKGLHILIKAMLMILREYPQSKIYVAGLNPIDKPFWRITGYGKYLKKLLKKTSLMKHVVFLGMLDERQMCERYLQSNVFVCPSSIENSPNSLGEAQLMGVPCIASYVGGIPDMMNGYERGGMYRFEEVEMLAKLICDIFSCSEYTGSGGSEIAHRRHDPIENAARTIEIYREIAG